MRKGSIEVSIYRPLTPGPAPTHLGATSSSDLRGRRVAAVCAGVITVALHLLFISSVEWGLGPEAARPAKPMRPRPEGNGSESSPMEWIALGENPQHSEAQTTPDIEPVLRAVRLAALPQEATIEDPDSVQPTADSADEPSQLYGRYLGQIDARIERAWLRPRTPIGAPSFSCTVQVEQDATGWVRDIMLVQCNGDVRWQTSLVRAIQAASPLPAPPDPKVFKHQITLRFRGEAYSDGSNPYLYEPDRVGLPAASR